MLEKLFEKVNSELLTDEVKLELSTIFESMVNQAIEEKQATLEEQNKAEIAEFKEELVGKLDEYLTYFVEEFTRDNEQQIEESVKVKTAERVLRIFEGLVNEFNMELDESQASNETELAEAKSEISKQAETILSLRKQIREDEQKRMVESKVAEFETDTDKERFIKLAESVSAEDLSVFGQKLEVIAGVIRKETKPAPQQLEEEKIDDKVADAIQEPEKKSGSSRYLKYMK